MASHAGYFLLLNLPIGGAFPDAVAGFTTPTSATVPGCSMLVDYVAVWTSGGSGTSPTTTTTTSSGSGNGWSAYTEIQAEQATARSGGTVESISDSGGGQDVGRLKNGDWLRFAGVRFGSTTASQVVARAASGAGGSVSGLVEVRLDSPTATPVGSFAIGNTGGWQSWRTVPANMGGVTGTHDVYLTFTSGRPSEYVSLNWVKFA